MASPAGLLYADNGKPRIPIGRTSSMPARNSRSRAKKNDIITLLKEDHKKVKSLLEDLLSGEESEASEIGQLFDEIERELKLHTELEEKHVYPIFKETGENEEDGKMFFEAHEEHHIVDIVLEDLRKAEPGSESFMARAKVLDELVRHHIKEEEKEMLPRLKKLVDEQQLEEIGARVMEMKQQMQPEMAHQRR
jgi:hemerythrin superfamily protein